MTKDAKIGICGVALVGIAMLAYAMFGRPPYAFFRWMKLAVAISTGLGAWALFAESKRYMPVSLCLVLLGGIHLFARMRRSQWAPFDWAAVVGLIVLVLILLATLTKRKT